MPPYSQRERGHFIIRVFALECHCVFFEILMKKTFFVLGLASVCFFGACTTSPMGGPAQTQATQNSQQNKLPVTGTAGALQHVGMTSQLGPTQQKLQPGDVTVNFNTVHDTKQGVYKVDASYPVVILNKGTKAAADQINKTVVDFISGKVKNFEDAMGGSPSTPVTPDQLASKNYPSYFTVSFVPMVQTGSLLAFRFDVQDLRGAGQPSVFTYGMNFDAKTGKQIQIADLFKSGSDYVQELSTQVTAVLNKVLAAVDTGDATQNATIKKDILSRGAAKVENFQNFNLAQDSIIVYFPLYQAAGGIPDASTIQIPLSTFSKILDSKGLAGASATGAARAK